MNDYAARFGLELVIAIIAVAGIAGNFALKAHAHDSSKTDNSVIFSYLSANPKLNTPLIAADETTTIVSATDIWIPKSEAATQSVILASTNSTTNSSPTTIQDNVILKTNPSDTENLRHGKTTYDIATGDTLISIASSFGISPATIMVENNLTPDSVIHPGQAITILPIDGISYTMKDGDTLEAVASKYKVDLDDLLEVNDLELTTDAQPGDNIIIPTQVTLPSSAPKKYVTNTSGQIAATKASAPATLSAGNLNFIWPTYLWVAAHGSATPPESPAGLTPLGSITQGFSSRHSGLDISDSKMEPIYAAESGFVEWAGWNSSGYGNMILINHGGGFKTRYGHTSQIFVQAGQYVEKGQLIGMQGHTGHVVGATGIHLHFEIIVNGRTVNPLIYVKP
ncbi:MAG TPA: peptidoglycan DD-metalloendopeptidase family protein [Patescibacteria group bacterium]|nr:peptidoglycan DD-metalloendopeptidase family protein [Patescibacteria group bacterium]